MSRNPRVSLDDDGTLDDFFATGVRAVHFEALDKSRWYATVTLDNGDIWQLDFGAQNDRANGYARAEFIYENPRDLGVVVGEKTT